MIKNISDEGLELIKRFEGFRSKAYYDSVGVLTIGYGSTNAMKSILGFTITPASTCTKSQASDWLRKAIDSKYGVKVQKYDSIYHWTQNEYDTLCSFCYNIGNIDGLTANGTRNKKEISNKILLYNKAGGKVLKGLTDRRKLEQELFLKCSSDVSYYPKCKIDSPSIIACLSSVGEADTSYKHRKVIAENNNIKFYIGSASQNLQMVKLIKEGKLKR